MGAARRIWLAALGLLLLLLVLGALKGGQIATAVAFGKRARAAGPPPETVATFVAQKQTWDETLPSVGSVTAARGVTVSTDAPGIVSRIDFESGETVRAGQTLVELDIRVERAQLDSARARKTLAAENLERTRALVASGAVAPAQLDNDRAQLNGATSDVDALAATIDRKIVRAPFAGRLGIRLVNVGQYLGAGAPITVLESSEAIFVDFDLPQQNLGLLKVGMPVRVAIAAGDAGPQPPTAQGSLYAIEPRVDPITRNIKLRATVPRDDGWLRPGMFVNVAVVEPQTASLVALPATAIVHASYGDSVFTVEGGKARQQFVRIGRTRGDFVEITDGVTPGQEVVTGGAFKLRNGMPVVVNNEVQPRPELAPNPPNR